MRNVLEERTAEVVPVGDAVPVRIDEERRALPGEMSASRAEHDGAEPLFSPDAIEDLRNRWSSIQAGFVDEPRTAVQQADDLVGVAMKRLADAFAEQRNNLERQWARGADASTEDLRQALRKYRSFFERLLAVQVPSAGA